MALQSLPAPTSFSANATVVVVADLHLAMHLRLVLVQAVRRPTCLPALVAWKLNSLHVLLRVPEEIVFPGVVRRPATLGAGPGVTGPPAEGRQGLQLHQVRGAYWRMGGGGAGAGVGRFFRSLSVGWFPCKTILVNRPAVSTLISSSFS